MDTGPGPLTCSQVMCGGAKRLRHGTAQSSLQAEGRAMVRMQIHAGLINTPQIVSPVGERGKGKRQNVNASLQS